MFKGLHRSGIQGIAALLLCSGAVAADQSPVVAVESIGVTVSDLDRAMDFYSNVLTFEKSPQHTQSGARVASLRLGEEQLELMQPLGTAGRPMPADSRGNDRWFQHIAIIVSDMDAAYARLRSFKAVHASSYPQRLPDFLPNAAGIKAFYFRDPDGHFLEILQFPPDKGAAKWHRATDKLFLGIDHTAIVVADTDTSLRFYRDQLGLQVAGRSDNYGFEQEHLNNVFGAHLLITALRAPQGPGIEFLEYLAPRDGRPMPTDTQARDIWYWQINLRAAQPQGLLRDPDGHASFVRGAGK